MTAFVPLVVRRYLGSRRGFTRVVTLFSVLGILLGVAALIIVLAVMSGFRTELMDRILGASGHGSLQIAGLQAKDARVLATELGKIDGVAYAVPYVSGQVMVSAGGRATGAYVRGIDSSAATLGPKAKVFGRDLGEPNEIMIGEGLSGMLGVVPDDGVTLISPAGARTVAGFIPRTGQFTVGGVFSIGMVQFDNGLVLGGLADMQEFLRKGEGVDALEIHLKDPQQVDKLAPQIRTVANRFAADETDVVFTPWTVTNAEFFRALEVERITMFIILSLIVLVAAFNIITGQMMLVNDKLSDIAILRTMGATQGQIRRIFLFNGLLLGGLGTAGGIVLGLLAVWNMASLVQFIKGITGVDLFPRDVYFLSELPGRLSLTDLSAVVGMAMFLTVLASLYPAWRASKFDPVELLRRG